MDERDVVVIGGGPAGYAAAIRVAQLGGKATLIEKDTPGGTCISRGCIPVRALVRAAELIDLGRSAREYGINYQEAALDLGKMISRKDTIVKTVSSGVRLLLQGNGVEIVSGAARFLSPSEIEATTPGGDSMRISTRRTIIATGSTSPIPSGPGIITTNEAIALREIPDSVLIAGGGFIGLAFATIFSRLGSRVTVIEESDRLLAGIDAEIVAVLEKDLKKNRVQVHAGTQLAAMSQSDEQRKVTITQRGENLIVDAALVLLAEGRRPNIEDIGLEKTGIALNDKGGINVNGRMETNVPGIFAAGDVTMDRMFTHVAYAEGLAAAENAMGKSSSVDYGVIPLCANTIPEAAGVGLTEEEAIETGDKIRVGRFPFAANAAATILGQRTGTIKIIADEKYGQILGAHIVGPQASTLIAEIALAMKLEATTEDIGRLMHGHPTLSEVCWEAARDVTGETIHFMKG